MFEQSIERSLELPIGTRFYYQNRLHEVIESEDRKWGCSQCAFDNRYDEAICEAMNCNNCRHDKKIIFFKEVKEIEE